MCKIFPMFLEKMVVIIDPDDKHNTVVPAPVSDDIMAMGPTYQIWGPTMSMMHQHQCQSHRDDVMAVGPAYQIEPIWLLDPQQATSKPIL